MRKFIERALNKMDRLDPDQIRTLLQHLASDNDRLETVLDSMTDAVLVLDASHRLLIINKAAERMLPLRQGDILEDLIWNCFDDADLGDFVKTTLESESTESDVEFYYDKGGAVRTISVSVLPLVKAGRIQGSLLHMEDITDRKDREARLRRAESLASLTTLAAGVAHEIKNPLGSIGIHIQLIQRALKQDGIDKDTIGDYLDVVNEEVERLNQIVVDFLFAVRPIDVHLETRFFQEILDDFIRFIHFELEENEIELTTDIDKDLPKLDLDEKFIKQALLNIVKNAMHAMPKGGQLHMALHHNRDFVQLRIADTGVGMSDEVRNKIFEPYFTTRDFGSGIGLTLVYKIFKEHKAEISVASREGQGTIFTINFPIPQGEKRLIGYKDEE